MSAPPGESARSCCLLECAVAYCSYRSRQYQGAHFAWLALLPLNSGFCNHCMNHDRSLFLPRTQLIHSGGFSNGIVIQLGQLTHHHHESTWWHNIHHKHKNWKDSNLPTTHGHTATLPKGCCCQPSFMYTRHSRQWRTNRSTTLFNHTLMLHSALLSWYCYRQAHLLECSTLADHPGLALLSNLTQEALPTWQLGSHIRTANLALFIPRSCNTVPLRIIDSTVEATSHHLPPAT